MIVGAMWRILRTLGRLWLPPIVFSFVAIAALSYWDGTGFSFPANKLVSVSADLLGFMGIVTAILIGVLTSIYVQSRSTNTSGYSQFIEALDEVRFIPIQMRERSSRAQPSDQDLLRDWANRTTALEERLNEVTMDWQGWETDRTLESDVLNYVDENQTILTQMGTFIASDVVWSRIWINIDVQVRRILIGLRAMDEGIVGQQLVNRLFNVFISLVVLLSAGVGIRIVADVGYGSESPDLGNLYFAILIGMITVFHLAEIGLAANSWRRALQRKRDAWIS